MSRVASAPNTRQALPTPVSQRPQSSSPSATTPRSVPTGLTRRTQRRLEQTTAVYQNDNEPNETSTSHDPHTWLLPRPPTPSSARLAASNSTALQYYDRETMYNNLLQLKAQVHTLETEKRALKAQARRAEEEVHRSEKRYEELLLTQAAVEGAYDIYDRLKLEENHMSTLKKCIRDQAQKIQNLQQEVSTMRSDVRHTRMAEMELKVKTYYQEVIKLQRQLDGSSASQPGAPVHHEDAMIEHERLTKELDSVRQELKSLIDSSKNRESKLGRLQNDYNEAIKKLEQSEKSAVQVSEQLNRLQKQSKEANRADGRHKTEMDNLQKEWDETKKKLSALESESKEREAKLQKQISNLETEKKKLNAQLEKAEQDLKEIPQLKAALTLAQEQVNAVEEQWQAAAHELEGEKEALLRDLQQERAAVEVRAAEFHNRQYSWEQERRELQQKLEQFLSGHEAVTAAERERDQLKQLVRELTASSQAASTQHENALAMASNRINDLQHQIDQLTDKLRHLDPTAVFGSQSALTSQQKLNKQQEDYVASVQAAVTSGSRSRGGSQSQLTQKKTSQPSSRHASQPVLSATTTEAVPAKTSSQNSIRSQKEVSIAVPLDTLPTTTRPSSSRPSSRPGSQNSLSVKPSEGHSHSPSQSSLHQHQRPISARVPRPGSAAPHRMLQASEQEENEAIVEGELVFRDDEVYDDPGEGDDGFDTTDDALSHEVVSQQTATAGHTTDDDF